jgi:hypothetical protein
MEMGGIRKRLEARQLDGIQAHGRGDETPLLTALAISLKCLIFMTKNPFLGGAQTALDDSIEP